eukprot:1195367-Prorocentrum_minimum.AAC.3
MILSTPTARSAGPQACDAGRKTTPTMILATPWTILATPLMLLTTPLMILITPTTQSAGTRAQDAGRELRKGSRGAATPTAKARAPKRRELRKGSRGAATPTAKARAPPTVATCATSPSRGEANPCRRSRGSLPSAGVGVIYCLPSCDWFSCWVYAVSPSVIGSHDGHILPPLLRLVLRVSRAFCPAALSDTAGYLTCHMYHTGMK